MFQAKVIVMSIKTYRFEAADHWYALHAWDAFTNHIQYIGEVGYIFDGQVE